MFSLTVATVGTCIGKSLVKDHELRTDDVPPPADALLPLFFVFRRQKQQEPERHSNNNSSKTKKSGKSASAGGGTSSVRNSWSFTSDLPMQVPTVATVKENIYVDPETLINANGELKAVSRSRLRQRSVSNLNAAALAGTRERRDHSSSNRHQNGGTMAKGVDYIRIHQPTPVRAALAAHHQSIDLTTALPPATNVVDLQIQDRSEYGNPDGSSAHSTAERDSGVVANVKPADQTGLLHPVMDLYQAINQNQSNDYKIIQGYVMQPEMGADGCVNRDSQQHAHPGQAANAPMVRHGSGRGSATNARGFPSSSSSSVGSTGKTSAEVVHRKPAAAGSPMPTSTGPNAVKTEWTFLPSPTAASEPQHREINSKPEESSMVRKGLLWVMRDRLFSRYHERFCILTRNYLHCFKKGSEASLTQMGNFLFKVNLAEVIAVQWLDKRGTAIVCLTLAKEGRLLVKTSMDLNGWFDDLQCCVKETIGRRQTLLMDQRGRAETFTSSSVSVAQQQQPQQQQRPAPVQSVYRDRSLAARDNNKPTNRFSLMVDHEVKLTGTGGSTSDHSDNGLNNSAVLTAEPQSLGNYNAVPAQVASSTPPPAAPGPPVPVPYRERSVSFDRSRVSKAEREAKRRSYYPSNHVTQV
uniref:Bile salt-activated lipase n=3 Tax=Daphnia magna TaxID=35525 RepID=A0A0N8EMD3_9CRUS